MSESSKRHLEKLSLIFILDYNNIEVACCTNLIKISEPLIRFQHLNSDGFQNLRSKI